MTQTEALQYWRESAKTNRQAAIDTMDKRQEWAFFVWHLAIEKLLKGLIIKSGDVPPPTHTLLILVQKANITLSQDQINKLKEIHTYNIDARYDDYTLSLYKKVSLQEYKEIWTPKCEEIYLWFSQLY